MRKRITVLLWLFTFAFSNHISAECVELKYALTRIEDGSFFIEFSNRSQQSVVLKSFVVVFENEAGQAIDYQEVNCDCRFAPGASKKFGPFQLPSQTTQLRVTKITCSSK